MMMSKRILVGVLAMTILATNVGMSQMEVSAAETTICIDGEDAHETTDIELTEKEQMDFVNAFYDSLEEDGISKESLESNIVTRGVKSKAAKIAAKSMLKKLYKIGSKSFNKAVAKAATKLPKKAGDLVKKHVTYGKISTVLNIAVNLEGDITSALEKGMKKVGLPSAVAKYGSKIVVFVLL